MAFWALGAQVLSQQNPWIWKAQASETYRNRYNSAAQKELQKENALATQATAERNLAKVQSDRQVTLTEEASNDAIRRADVKLLQAATGDSTMAYVGAGALAKQTADARDKINNNYDANLNTQLSAFKSASADFYTLNMPFTKY